jgi:hypothetical protein
LANRNGQKFDPTLPLRLKARDLSFYDVAAVIVVKLLQMKADRSKWTNPILS